MFEKKPYINVRGIGKINCKPELSADDAQMIGIMASMIPFREDVSESGDGTGKTAYIPELVEYAFWSSFIVTVTDLPANGDQIWRWIYETDVTNKLASYYSSYIEDIYDATHERIYTKARTLAPINDEALFNSVARSLENVDIADVLELAKSISQMDGHEIVRAVAESASK